jgi:hypothetical protein
VRGILYYGAQGGHKSIAVGGCNFADALRLIGMLRGSERASRLALEICREQGHRFDESMSAQLLGLALAARGATIDSGPWLARGLLILGTGANDQREGVANASLAQRALWLGDAGAARHSANRAWKLAHDRRFERDLIRAARLRGEVTLALGDLQVADQRLHDTLIHARASDLVEEELPALTAVAELHRRQDNPAAARVLLDQVWESAERGHYPLFHADALNVLAQIERDAGNIPAAIQAATEAYTKAWCDGPPFAYHWGLEKARAHLAALGAPEPVLPPFDESKYEPMPEIEIDPA